MAESLVRPLLKRTRLVDEVTTRLRELILTDQLEPGVLIRQVELAEQLGVSRTPLREAFRILESDGLVRTSNGNNTMEVVRLSVDEIRQLYEVREVLDGLAARLLAERRLTREETEELRGALEIMEASSNPYNPARYGPAHTRFHCGICDASGNQRLRAYGSVIRLSSQSLTRRLVALSSDAASEQEQEFVRAALIEAERDHREIFELIAAGDGRAAETAARRHIRRTIRSEYLMS
jgi:GntR family transcriptional regulator of vanillate catabolism